MFSLYCAILIRIKKIQRIGVNYDKVICFYSHIKINFNRGDVMILAIDPGNIESGYVLTYDDLVVINKGKEKNENIIEMIK